ncbi:hypothetical protein HHI36_019108 [Cryptolaemus montrouzieri]|uniref:Uncharacterized protein n=1 Tax=Cryptolaemus montrouzieri TaxID=559131 RepID=A0ABD2P2Q0_9CUCU
MSSTFDPVAETILPSDALATAIISETCESKPPVSVASSVLFQGSNKTSEDVNMKSDSYTNFTLESETEPLKVSSALDPDGISISVAHQPKIDALLKKHFQK